MKVSAHSSIVTSLSFIVSLPKGRRVAGKGDGGLPAVLSTSIDRSCHLTVVKPTSEILHLNITDPFTAFSRIALVHGGDAINCSDAIGGCCIYSCSIIDKHLFYNCIMFINTALKETRRSSSFICK